jgi:probable phosphoglycerate mutase
MTKEIDLTTYYLVRHGDTDFTGTTIIGRTPGISLNARGRWQAEQIARRLCPEKLSAIYASPLERAMETAQPLSTAKRIAIEHADSFVELQYGDWTGRTIESLRDDPVWRRYNQFRSGTAIPGGEHMVDVQLRAVRQLELFRHAHSGQSIAIFTHGDVIRSVIAHFAGIPLDLFLRLTISPGSISVVTLDEYGPGLTTLNDVSHLVAPFAVGEIG